MATGPGPSRYTRLQPQGGMDLPTSDERQCVNGEFQTISRSDLIEVADRFGVRKPQDPLADVRAALDIWSDSAKHSGLPPLLTHKVAQDLLPV